MKKLNNFMEKLNNFTKILNKALVTFLLASLLVLSACSTPAPSRFDQAQQSSTQKGAEAVSKDALAGGEFNKFFPRANGDYQLVFAQEKSGFALAKLKQDGKTVASLSISDTVSNPSTASKYQQSTDKLNGYPLVNQGSKSSGVLVSNRFQVKITSSDDSFTESDRLSWLKKFDLNGLDRLK